MYAIEFEADVNNGIIEVPIQHKELNSKHVRIIALIYPKNSTATEHLNPTESSSIYTDEYIENNWRKLIITSSTTPQQDDDMILQNEYGDYLNAKHSI
jgi:hypothetical protein